MSRRSLIGLLSFGLAVGLAAGGGNVALAKPSDQVPRTVPATKSTTSDDPTSPQEQERRALRERAVRMVLNGQAKVRPSTAPKWSRSVRRTRRSLRRSGPRSRPATGPGAKGRPVRRARPGDRPTRSSSCSPSSATSATRTTPTRTPIRTRPARPLRRTAAQRDPRARPQRGQHHDLAGGLQPGHFQKLYFGTGSGVQSVKNYYQRQSSGRYAVDGTVTDWVKVRTTGPATAAATATRARARLLEHLESGRGRRERLGARAEGPRSDQRPDRTA